MKLTIKRKAQFQIDLGAPWMSVDPGLSGTGWAVWSSIYLRNECEPPTASGAFKAVSDREWWWRCEEIASQVMLRCEVYRVRKVYMELPTFMEGGSGLGITVARRGDLVKLTVLFGIIAGKCCQENRSPYTREGFTSELVPVEIAAWKGQLPKDVCHARIRKRLGRDWNPTTDTTHEMDAVGIGLHVKGFF